MFHLSLGTLAVAKSQEEIVQDTFVKLWEIEDTLNPQFNLRNFLYTYTKSISNHLRNQKIILKHQENLKYLEMQFNYEALEKLGNYIELKSCGEKLMMQLPPCPLKLGRFPVVSLRATIKEISAILTISVKTVEARMTKAF